MFRLLSREQKKILNIISFVEFSRMLGIFLIIPVIALFAEKFTTSGVLIGVAVASYEISMALYQIPMGKLSDKIGRRNAIIIGLIPFILGNLFSFYSNTILILIASRFVAGSGAISSPAISWAQESVDSDKKGLSMSYVGAAIGMAFLIGTSFSAEISNLFGIRSVFLISVLVGIISLIMIFLTTSEKNRNQEKKLIQWPMKAKGKVLLFSLISFFVSTAVFIFFYLLQVFSAQHYGISGYSYIFFIPVITGGAVAIYFTERYRRIRMTMPKEISFPIMGIGLLLLSIVAFIHISALELSVLLIPFFVGYSFFELLMIPFLSSIIRNQNYGVGIGIFYSFQFLGSSTGAIIGGLIMGNHSTSYLIQVSLAICIMAIVISFFMSARFTNSHGHLEVK